MKKKMWKVGFLYLTRVNYEHGQKYRFISFTSINNVARINKSPTKQDKSQIVKRHLYNLLYPILSIAKRSTTYFKSNSIGYLAS